ncbi:hypothetical protein [Endozoicomonas sp. GU-1]|uniref:hypothetical protein n=1 Tax=unclassified Endozoicomonas TaxID=2644528 RepID=UPI0022B493DF|nr:hypothetical protein [Endozoicomonas sp. GU-1]WBA81968.1 hypothetical protein O2T12_02025 [Endozoicomonas sp. GU-1]WBA84917.1 hypothetical protein O3276_16795 [Endozoicomonas sp. GU-1]
MAEQFFLSIRQHGGVYYRDGLDPKGPDALEEFDDFLLNLKLVQRIFFDNETITGLANFSSSDSDNEKYPCIQFMAEDSQGLSILCSLIFKPAGMGEYHRYKRQIESITIDGICEKVEQTDDKPEQTEGELILEMEAVDG